MSSAIRLAVLVAAFAARALPCAAEATPAGAEFQTNVYTTGAQDIPQVAGLADGGFVVVWQSKYLDGDQDGIFARRYTADGTPVGDEAQVNVWTTGNQQRPAVASDAAGNFVVVWQSYGQEGGADFGIVARRHGPSGAPDGGEFAVNEHTTGNQNRPTVAAAPDGGFVLSWASDLQDGDGFGIFARRLRAGGGLGPEFQVNTWTTGSQYHPGLGVSGSGDFVVVWDGPGQFGDAEGVMARRYAADGTPLAEFQANAYTTGNQYRPSVASAPTGEFVVAWNGPGNGDASGIFARRFDAAGAPLGGEFQANTFTTGVQYRPAVAADVAGNFVVVWQSYAQDGQYHGVFGQQFRADGAPVGAEFQANTYTTAQQNRPGAGMLPNGDFVVVWRSYAQDGSSYGAFARRFTGGIASTTTSTSTSTTAAPGATTSTTLPASLPLALRALVVKPGRLVKVVSEPIPAVDPSATGAVLTLAGTTGTATYDLPAGCWTRIRARGGGTKGYRCRQAPCAVSLRPAKGLRAACRGATGDLGPLPEPGPVTVRLEAAGTTLCGACGGTPKGRAATVFKRRRCAAPSGCA